MSRAFMKERDDLAPAEIVPQSGDPRPMTAAGFRELCARIEQMPAGTERDELQRIADVAEVAPVPEDRRVVSLGATVTLEEDPAGAIRTFTIVGEDEIDIERGKVGSASPLAQALLGKRAGQAATWKRPAGDRRLIIRSVAYPDPA